MTTATGNGQAHVLSAKTMADGMVSRTGRLARHDFSHGPPPNGMPAMTMVSAADAEWLGKLREGEKIRFTAEDAGDMTLTQFETIGE